MYPEMQKDFSPTGLKFVGPYENDRNQCNSGVYKDIIREAFGVQDVICGHHLVYVANDKRTDGFNYTIVEEIPSADALIFDHEVGKKIWGEGFKTVLAQLAMEPPEDRDNLLQKLYYGRAKPAETKGH